MSRANVLLVNPNRMRPPIGPIGLEYVAAALCRHAYKPFLCDLTFAEDIPSALDAALAETKPLAVGVSIRNIDDAYFASQDFVLEEAAGVVRHLLEASDAPVVLGGVGFSIAPQAVLRYTGATYGIAGEDEEAFCHLLDCLAAGARISGVPGAVFRSGEGSVIAVPPQRCHLASLPVPSRRLADHPRYFAEGGQAGVETKRGCNGSCVYCVEPRAKGRRLHLRSPESVAREFADLLEQGIDVVHLCDSEFNLPPQHAEAVCDALIRSGIAPRIRWYTYASPYPFNEELARVMVRAGCLGVNFGIDHGDAAMLQRLGRDHELEDIRRAVRACQSTGIAVMLDMLLGAPGETKESLVRGIEFVRSLNPDCVGLSCGVRVYPNTLLAWQVRMQGPFASNPHLHGAREDNADLLRPIFYVDAALDGDIHALVASVVGGDRRFLAAASGELDRNYNYNDNSLLSQAIRSGKRGAYWDILRRLRRPA